MLVCALAGCGKKEEEKPAEKHEENIVTLTKENLEHVEIKTEPVALGSIETTLKGGRPGHRKSEQDGACE